MKKNISTFFIVTVLSICSCAHAQNNQTIEQQFENKDATHSRKDKEEIKKLIQQVLGWGESKESIDLLPVLTDSKDSVYIGFDMSKLKANIEKLRETNFFTNEFIENYNRIILTLDRKLRGKQFEEWLVGDLPTFQFANDINPWCLCQGYSSGEFHDIEIVKINSKSGELIWKWGNGSSWKDFRFRVSKEDNKWKISYMEGFDYINVTKKR